MPDHGDDRSLTEVLAAFEREGYAAQFRPEDGGRARCGACEGGFDAGSLVVGRVARLEGASDPADMVLVVAARCPRCDALGSLVLTYGPMTPRRDAEVEQSLDLSGGRQEPAAPVPESVTSTGVPRGASS